MCQPLWECCSSLGVLESKQLQCIYFVFLICMPQTSVIFRNFEIVPDPMGGLSDFLISCLHGLCLCSELDRRLPNIVFCDDHRELISLWVESLHALTTLFKGLVNDPASRTLTHPAWSPARSPSRWRVVQAVNSSGQDQHFHRCL